MRISENFVKKRLWLTSLLSGLLIVLLPHAFIPHLINIDQYWPSCFGTWPSILWFNIMRTRCSERRLYKYVVFVIACTWMASNSRGDFSGCRNILKIWRKDGRSALLNCRKLLGAFFTPPFTVDLRARGRGTCEGPPRYLLISLFVFSISRKHNSSVYFYNRRKVACSVV